MGDILKEAIADAKAVRETALENAKMALEEAFTPQLKSMLSAKLKEEEDDDKEEGRYSEEDDEVTDEDEDEVPAEEGEHEPAEEGEHEPAEEDEDKLDLEAIIKELEDELTDEDEDSVEEGRHEEDEETEETEEPVEEEYEITLEGEDDEVEEDDEDLEEELDKSSGIGKGDNKEDNTDVSSAIGKGNTSLKEVQSELKEYKEAVSFLKNKLHEVNILNAKLLFTNKLFKSYSLDNNQKLKVVETFDRAQTTREIKLVYSTLAEQFSDNSSIVTKKSISESASTAVSSTKPSKKSRKVISEETQVANRFKKLAGLIK